MKKWRCKVCGYIYLGEAPPEVCPVCGAGAEFFEAIEEAAKAVPDHQVLQEALFKIPCGLFVVTAYSGGKPNGMINNTIFQITDAPLQLLVGMDKRHLTTEFVLNTGVLAVHYLTSDQLNWVRQFGFESGRTRDKFAGLAWQSKITGAPVLQNAAGYLECKIRPEQTIDAGTHFVFLAEVIAGEVSAGLVALTYQEYRQRKNELWMA